MELKNNYRDSRQGKYIQVFTPKLVLYYTVLSITSSLHPALSSQQPHLKITKY